MTVQQPLLTKITVGKLSSRGGGSPSDAGYVNSIREQMSELEGIIRKLLNDIEGVTPHIMLDAMIPLYALSQHYCPIEFGALSASGYLEITEFRGRPRVELGYARGGQPFYAMAVHERVEVSHAPPTRSKFLQAAVFERMGMLEKRLHKNFQDVFPETTA